MRSQHPANKSFRRRSVASLKFKRHFQCSEGRSESDVSVAVCKHNMQGFTPPTWLHNSGNAPPQLWLACVQPQGTTCIPPSPLAATGWGLHTHCLKVDAYKCPGKNLEVVQTTIWSNDFFLSFFFIIHPQNFKKGVKWKSIFSEKGYYSSDMMM